MGRGELPQSNQFWVWFVVCEAQHSVKDAMEFKDAMELAEGLAKDDRP
jgi:hypothetical protein